MPNLSAESAAVSPALVERLGSFYSYFLLIVSGLAATMRLLRPYALAEIMHVRLLRPRARRLYTNGAIALAFGSFLTLPLYLYKWLGQRWLIVAFIYGSVSALEFYTNAASTDVSSLSRQNRIYAVAYTLVFAFSCLVLFWK